MGGAGLIGISIVAGVLLLVGLVTPGWFGIDVKSGENDVSINMNIFYSRVCVQESAIDTCLTMSNAAAMERATKSDDSFRFTEYLVEAIGALIGCGCGTILAIIYGLSLVREQDSIRPRSSNLAVTGLVLSIIGGICGGILVIEFIIIHTKMDTVTDTYGEQLESSNVGFEKSFPYSLVIMSFGLFFELIAVIVHISCMRTPYTGAPNGIILTPAVNGPTAVVVQHSTVSSTPYARFA
ncbi:unnamed protein product [Mytilus edulis]|uniref:Uncharacterized protein n=1 Tax=Mytilus edulis TaxID=6550 RepID=A0A8S3R4C6_MYTED|nr:unnamed protein product [Mytilus edulis]